MGEWAGPKEKRHELTEEERQKGRANITPKRRKALALNALKHGRYAKTLDEYFVFCDSCAYRNSCLACKAGAACSLRIQILREINKVARGDAEAWLNVALRSLQDLFVLSKAAPDSHHAMERFVRLWVELGKVLFPKQIQVSQGEREIRVVFDEGNSED